MRPFTLAVLATFAATSVQAATLSPILVVKNTDAAPVAGTAQYSSVFGATVNNSGEIGFTANLSGVGITSDNRTARVSTTQGIIARAGDAVPGLPGATYSVIGNGRVNNAGDHAFRANIDTPDGNQAAIIGPAGVIARNGDTAPGTAGETFQNPQSVEAFDNNGRVAYRGVLNVSPNVGSTERVGIYDQTSEIVRQGDAAPGLPGQTVRNIRSFATNDAGDIALQADLGHAGTQGHIFLNDNVVAATGGSVSALAGATYTFFPSSSASSIEINASGDVAFEAFFEGAGITADNNLAIMTQDRIIARKGDAAPGIAGAYFSEFFDVLLSDRGTAVIQATLSGAGIDTTNNYGFFAETAPGELHLVARRGDNLALGGGIFTNDLTSVSMFSGALSQNGDQFVFGAAAAGFNGIFSVDLSGGMAAVPLPSSAWLLIAGVAAGAGVGRRKPSRSN